MSKEILIAGAGVAGLSLAEKLAEIPDVHTTIVAPNISVEAQVSTERRLSAPIVPDFAITRLSIEIADTPEINTIVCGLDKRGVIGRSILNIIEHFSKKGFKTNSLYAIDLENTRQGFLKRLYQYEQAGKAVSFIEGKIADVKIEKEKVTGVLVEGREEPIKANLVVDATGRSAKVASKLELGNIVEIRKSRPSMILASYIDLSDEHLDKILPDRERTLVIDILPKKLVAILAPTEALPNSDATHVILIEGNSHTIQEAVTAESVIDKEELNKRSFEQKHTAAMQKLTEGTTWHTVISEAKNIDRRILFTHKDDLLRIPQIPGIVLLGDAQGYINPINGVGLYYIAKDAQKLADAIAEPDLDNGVQSYNDNLHTVFDHRFKRSQRVAGGIQLLQKIL